MTLLGGMVARIPMRVIVLLVAVSDTLFQPRLLVEGCSDFPLCVAPVELRRATVLYS